MLRLEITVDGTVIGGYERLLHADIARRTEEVTCAGDYFAELCSRRGVFVVRRDSATRTKVIRDGFGNHIGEIPRAGWREPASRTSSPRSTA
ncbi:hypothetical protein CCO02nite_31110 [Cellulomonas composti]|uniref:Uncharacterized protein n=1 Tax=Cellulomonas composti TaxID=266130 RepID=A0A511JFF3_9CELL|nr:hypothetical protein CCO02nite_31110 [Cellulomonas composti]